MEALEAADRTEACRIAKEYLGTLNVCLVEAQPESARAILRNASKHQPFMTGLVITAHPDYVLAEASSANGLGFIEKPFAWCRLRFRLAERVNTSLAAHHQALMRRSSRLVEECRRLGVRGI